jgi:hypothetical protein
VIQGQSETIPASQMSSATRNAMGGMRAAPAGGDEEDDMPELESDFEKVAASSQ